MFLEVTYLVFTVILNDPRYNRFWLINVLKLQIAFGDFTMVETYCSVLLQSIIVSHNIYYNLRWN